MAHLCPYHADCPTFGRLSTGLNHIYRSPSLYLRPCHPSLRHQYKECNLPTTAVANFKKSRAWGRAIPHTAFNEAVGALSDPTLGETKIHNLLAISTDIDTCVGGVNSGILLVSPRQRELSLDFWFKVKNDERLNGSGSVPTRLAEEAFTPTLPNRLSQVSTVHNSLLNATPSILTQCFFKWLPNSLREATIRTYMLGNRPDNRHFSTAPIAINIR